MRRALALVLGRRRRDDEPPAVLELHAREAAPGLLLRALRGVQDERLPTRRVEWHSRVRLVSWRLFGPV